MKKILRSFLNAYWLRPETALWRTADVLAMEKFQFVSPSVDIGCGDGTFSFLRAAGEFGPDFDVFLSTDSLVNFFENEDIYNHYHSNFAVSITKNPQYKIDYAFDHKQDLLLKAKHLGLYNEYITGDANKSLPFADNSMQSVFSNILYWLDDPIFSIKEIYRILAPGGKCCIMLVSDVLTSSSFLATYEGKFGEAFDEMLQLIDRGRLSSNIKCARSFDSWKEIIEQSGFTIDSFSVQLSPTLVKIWDIGLRPISPMLIQFAKNISQEVKMEVKQQWVDLFYNLCYPVLVNEKNLIRGTEGGEYCFILSK